MPARLKIRVIGVGGAGLNALNHMRATDLAVLQFAAVDSSEREISHSPIPEKYVLGRKRFHGLGTGGDPGLGAEAAEEEAAGLKGLCAEADMVFIVTGLGGGTGTGAAPTLARVAKETGALVISIVTLPFEFEGARRDAQATEGLQRLKASADAVICLPNQKLLKLINENTSLLQAFKATDEMLAQAVRAIWQMLSRRGLIDVDFAYLYSVVRGRRAESSLATAEARGEHRGRDVVERLLASPFMEGGRLLSEADSVLVSVLGGPDLTIAEVNTIMAQINAQLERGHLVMGAAVDEAFAGRLSVTVIACRNGVDPEAAAKPDETAESNILDLGISLLNDPSAPKPPSRYVAPAPALTPEKTEQLWVQQKGSKRKKNTSRMRQGQLALEIVSKGRFEKSEPTIHQGEDLDVPTYIRRGISLN